MESPLNQSVMAPSRSLTINIKIYLLHKMYNYTCMVTLQFIITQLAITTFNMIIITTLIPLHNLMENHDINIHISSVL